MEKGLLQERNVNSWKEFRKKKCNRIKLPSFIDGVLDEQKICEIFSEKYKTLYNSVSYKCHEMIDLEHEVKSVVSCSCVHERCYSSHAVTVHEVTNAIKKLKKDKGDGYITKMSNFFIHTTLKFKTILSMVYTSLLVHCVVPNEMLIGTIIPLPKNKRKSINDSDNYRGICLSSIFGKILDNILLESNKHILSSSNLQFGFKNNCSTSQCTFVLNETIQYYLNQKSEVYCILLDASKAFDNVQYIKLFKLLQKKGLCPIIIRFLIKMYTCQKLRIKWGNELSPEFSVSNGVKQGGVLSPILFCIYIDELLHRLKASGYGCHIGDMFLGALGYADDVTLLAPRLSSLKCMLSVVQKFGEDYNVTFNPSKSQFLIYGKNKTENINVIFNGSEIKAVPYTKHLGNLIGPKVRHKTIEDIQNDFIIRVNFIMSNFGNCNHDVKYKLMKVTVWHYMVLYYGTSLTQK